MASSDLPWVAVIPARFASTRFPGKPLVSIAGVPLVIRVARRVAMVEELSSVVVATDDDRIEATCREFGVEACRTPSGCPTGTDRVWEAVKTLDPCMVLNVQGDEPLVDPEAIRRVMAAKRTWPNAVVNAQAPLDGFAELKRQTVPKMVATSDGLLLYASRAPVPAENKTDEGLADLSQYRKQICIYAFDAWQLRRFGEQPDRCSIERLEDIEILRFLELGIEVRMVDVSGGTQAVDVPEDVARVEEILRSSKS